MRYRRFFTAVCLLALICCIFLVDAALGSSAPELSDKALYSLLFDIHNKITLRLDMEEAEIAKMQADYDTYSAMGSKSPIYRIGDLHITIETPNGRKYKYAIEEVGVRMKGNTSRHSFYNAEESIYNIIHLKLSFQETFDDPTHYGADAMRWEASEAEARKDRTFATLEKLELRWNACDDGTYLRETFAYETFRKNGTIAPHCNLASFDWAGLHMGIFKICEPVDEIFLEKNLPKTALGGDLYKCGWGGGANASFTGLGSIGVEDEDQSRFYAYDLKTNKKTSTHESLSSFIRGINRKDITKEEFARLVDMDHFLPFAAVSYLLGNPDDMRNNYNNCYVYFRADNGKAIFIPYDYDRCLGINKHWNPTKTGVTDDNPFSTERLAIDREDTASDRAQYNPVIRYSVSAGGFYVWEYAGLLSQIAESDWFRYETFAEIYDIAKANYGNLTPPGKAFYNAEGMDLSFDIDRTADFSSTSNISIREYLDAKLKTLHAFLPQADVYAEMQLEALAPVWYIRSELTDWRSDEDYIMSESGDMMAFQLTLRQKTALKIYNSLSDGWYGRECVVESAVDFTTDGHTNIVLEKGEYLILIDPFTERITLKPA